MRKSLFSHNSNRIVTVFVSYVVIVKLVLILFYMFQNYKNYEYMNISIYCLVTAYTFTIKLTGTLHLSLTLFPLHGVLLCGENARVILMIYLLMSLSLSVR